MARYIDLETAKEKVIEACNPSSITAIKAISALEEIPTADVAKVVRCKDCKYYEIGKSYTPYCNNVENSFEEMKPTDFCSYGERK